MRRIVSLVVVIMLSVNAFAMVEGNEVAYVGGSATAVKPGDVGTFDTAPPNELVFAAPGGKVAIPYDKVTRIGYRTEVAYHLGVAAAIVVGLIKQRARKHFLTLTYTDESGVGQAAVFEVAKNASPALLALLKARAPKACVITQPNMYAACQARPKQ